MSKQKELIAEIRKMLPIVKEAFWDHHTAGTLPGSGYNHKAQHLAGLEWGWKSSGDFQSWHKSILELIGDKNK